MGKIARLDRPASMFQCEVVTRDKRTMRIGPKLAGDIGEHAVEALCLAIQKAIANGTEKHYRECCVVEIAVRYVH